MESMTRAHALGMSAAKFLRKLSCNQYVMNITSPMLIIQAHDDCITKVEHIPIDDLKKCPNALIAIYNKGGHCDFLYEKYSSKTGKKYHKEFMPEPTFAFFEQVDRALAKRTK